MVGLMTYYTVGFSLLIVSLIIFALSYAYRIREQAVKGVALLLFSLAFLDASYFQNVVTERLLNEYTIKYPIVKQLDVSVISGFKGPLITPTVPTAAWTNEAHHLSLIAVLLLLSGILLAYLASLMMGWDAKLAYSFTGIVAIIAIVATILTQKAVSTYISNPGANAASALHLRSYSNALKALTVILPWALMAVGSYVLYRETETPAYLVYTGSIILGLIGFLVFITTWTYGWDLYVEKLAAKGSIGPAIARFTASAILMIIGALGLLVGSIFEAMPPTEEAEEFEEEEIE